MTTLVIDLLAAVLLGAVCWVLRVSFVLFWSTDRLPTRAVQALEHLAPSAMASICAVELLGVLQTPDTSSQVASLVILGASVGVAVLARRGGRALTWTVLGSGAMVLLVDLWLL